MRSEIAPGGIFPDYELPGDTGTQCKLSELQGDDALILTLACGRYCPKEHQQRLELAAFYPRIAVAYTQVATISTDDHHTLQEFRASIGAEWTTASIPATGSGASVDCRPLPRPARRDEGNPPGPGPEHSWTPRGMRAGDFSRFHGWNKQAGTEAASIGQKNSRRSIKTSRLRLFDQQWRAK